jgi:hypothetical protein
LLTDALVDEQPVKKSADTNNAATTFFISLPMPSSKRASVVSLLFDLNPGHLQ